MKHAPNDEAMRSAYIADARVKARRLGLYFFSTDFPRNADGSYRRKDLEKDFQSFAESMRK